MTVARDKPHTSVQEERLEANDGPRCVLLGAHGGSPTRAPLSVDTKDMKRAERKSGMSNIVKTQIVASVPSTSKGKRRSVSVTCPEVSGARETERSFGLFEKERKERFQGRRQQHQVQRQEHPSPGQRTPATTLESKEPGETARARMFARFTFLVTCSWVALDGNRVGAFGAQ